MGVGDGGKSSSQSSPRKIKILTKRFVQFPVEISEKTYNYILQNNNDPSRFISTFIENTFSKEGFSLDTKLDIGSNNLDALEGKMNWTPDMMKEFIDHLANAMVQRPDIDVLLALLASYAEYGIARPSSQNLRTTRGLEEISDETWNQELRTSKSRLTITAKHLNFPHKKLFSSPYGKGAKRVHPINPECFKELLSWKDRGIVITGEDEPTGLLAARRFTEILKTPTPYHSSP